MPLIDTALHAAKSTADVRRRVHLPAIATDLTSAVPSIVPSDVPAMSDEECLVRLARAIEEHDTEHLDEVARLIGRLAVTIE